MSDNICVINAEDLEMFEEFAELCHVKHKVESVVPGDVTIYWIEPRIDAAKFQKMFELLK